MVTTARTEQKMVTGSINGTAVTVPAGTFILEAARQNGIEIPNLCYQPLLRPWGSCRICTVQILGRRGGLIESCTTPLAEGMEVLTHSPEVIQARQYILQMYLIDHALDCPTCDKSGECYLQDNTYLHNINANPYRRPKLAQPYQHFSDTIDYKWDRCIMCNRCTRVCDEMVGVIAIESAGRSLEATITPAFGLDLSETTCTNCGMCIAVCPVGALTDRHFGHHPWELDTTETICGHCDGGCTLNIETNRSLVRRVTHLWERGVNHGYTCEKGKWGWEQVQHPDRLLYPRVRDGNGVYETNWAEAIDIAAEELAHYQGDAFAALASPDTTNEEAYQLQLFTRAVMGSNSIDRLVSPAQRAVGDAVLASLGEDVSNTNNLQEMLTDVSAALVVGPDLGKSAPVPSYWFYHSKIYRESKIVVISQDDYPLCHRAELWLRPNPGTTAILLSGIAAEIVQRGLAAPDIDGGSDYATWTKSLGEFSLDSVASLTGVPADDIRTAAIMFATGGSKTEKARPDGGFPPSLIYQTAAHFPGSNGPAEAANVSTACNNLSILTGNIGRAGGGVASFRGFANYQGVTDMGAVPGVHAGVAETAGIGLRDAIAATWLARWGESARTKNGFVPVRELPTGTGIGIADLPAAIERGDIQAMYIEGTIAGRHQPVDQRLYNALAKLKYLVVADTYDSPLAALANVVLPVSMYLEKDGTFTSFDRTVQRVRAAVPAMGEAKSHLEAVALLAQRLGYNLEYRQPVQVMSEIAQLVPAYAGVTYARLERSGVSAPVASFAEAGTPILSASSGLQPRLLPVSASTSHLN